MNYKKICFLNMNAYSLFNQESNAPTGGTEVQLFNISKYLSAKINTSFIVGDWNQQQVEVYDKIKVYKSISLKKTVLNYIKAPFLIWQKLREVNADVYITSAASAEVGVVALFCKIKKRKFIYRTAHEMDCSGEYIENNGLRGLFFRYGLKRADVIVTQNKEHKKVLKSNYDINAIVIKNGFIIDKNDTQQAAKRYILWVARCDDWKNPELFLKIVKIFPNENFKMISPVVNHNKVLFKSIKKLSATLNNLEFISKVPFIEIQEYFNEARLFIGTSEYEGFPNTYLQACMGGTPIISYKVNPDKFITKNNLGYCASGNFGKMLKQVKSSVNNEQKWMQLSKNALKYVKKEHDILNIGRQWEAVIDNIII